MFQIILVLILAYYFYRLYSRRKIKNANKKKSRRFYPPPHPETPRAQDRIIEEMKRCPACGTFNPKSYALYYEGEYFCSIECRNQRN